MIEQFESINRILGNIQKPMVFIENDFIYIDDTPIDISDEKYLDAVESAIINILMGSLSRALGAERKHEEIMIFLDE